MKLRNLGGLAFLLAFAAFLTAAVVSRLRPVAETPLTETLLRAPGVVRVEAPRVASGNPTRRIVHILDYHFVPRELYGPDGYAEHLAKVEAVQEEHMALLRWLASKQGVSEVFVEGLTEENLPSFFEKARGIEATGAEEIPRLMEQLADARASGAGRGRQIEKQIADLLEDHRESLLSLGGAGRLCLAGKLDVLPLDDAGLLEKSKPRFLGGRLFVNPAIRQAREDAMVRNALRGGESIVVLVLGAGHDLTESIRAEDPRCGYIRVTTKKVAELTGVR